MKKFPFDTVGFLHGPVEEMGADAVIDHFDELIGYLEWRR